MDTTVEKQTPPQATALSRKAYWLLGLAAALPVVFGLSGLVPAAPEGVVLGRLTALFAVTAGIAWLVQRRSTPMAKAKGRVRIGVGFVALSVFLTGFTAYVEIREKGRDEAFTRAVMARRTDLQQQLALISAEFDKLDFSTASGAESLSNPEAIANTRALLARYASLVDERHQAIQQFGTDIFDRYALKSDVSDYFLKTFLEGFAGTFSQTKAAFGELDDSQHAFVIAYSGLLDFADQNIVGKLKVQNGKIIFKDQTQLERFKSEAALLKSANDRVEAAVKAVGVVQRSGQAPR